jgi:hypothetical protein
VRNFSFRNKTNGISLSCIDSSVAWLSWDIQISLLVNFVYPLGTCSSVFCVVASHSLPTIHWLWLCRVFLIVLTHSLHPAGTSHWFCVVFSRSCNYNFRCMFFLHISRFDWAVVRHYVINIVHITSVNTCRALAVSQIIITHAAKCFVTFSLGISVSFQPHSLKRLNPLSKMSLALVISAFSTQF